MGWLSRAAKAAKKGDKAAGLVDRYGTVDDYLQNHLAMELSPVRWALRAVGALLFAGLLAVMTWFSYLTTWIQPYGPFVWVLAGVVLVIPVSLAAAGAVAIVGWAAGFARQRWKPAVSSPETIPASPASPAPQAAETPDTKPERLPAAETAEERHAKHELVTFAANHVLLTYVSEVALLRGLIEELCDHNEVISQLCWESFCRSGPMPEILESLKRLQSILKDNGVGSSLDEIEKNVAVLAEGYHAVANYPKWLNRNIEVDYTVNDDLLAMHNTQQEFYRDLIDAYQSIRRNPMFSRLYSVRAHDPFGKGFITDA